MTEREAEVFAWRLERIWEPVSHFTIALSQDSTKSTCVVVWHLNAMLDSEFQLEVYTNDEIYVNEWADSPFIQLNHRILNTQLPEPILCTRHNRGDNGQMQVQMEDFADASSPIVIQWLPLFRRGCWLSGCDIEATGHEKAEWMQGFSHEEVEVWNLNG